jgi:hypothetical protein
MAGRSCISDEVHCLHLKSFVLYLKSIVGGDEDASRRVGKQVS